MSSNWSDVTKHLDRTPGRIDTEQATKPYDRRVSRAITKLNYEFVIPATSINLLALGIQQAGALVQQYNYTAPGPFRILSLTPEIQQDLGVAPVICIRYRVGNTVYRYRLTQFADSELEDLILSFSKINAPLYTNQRIQANFAIEFWTLVTGQDDVVTSAMSVKTGLIRNPLDADEQSINVAALVNMDRAALKSNFPEALPTVYGANSCWLTN